MLICFAIAGILQFLICSANFVAIRMFRYREEIAKVEESIRQVFWVQNLFIVIVLIFAGTACFVYPDELSSGTGLGRGFSMFFAIFWGLRLGTQFIYYSPKKRRNYRFFDCMFLASFSFLTITFTLSAFGFWAP